MTKIANAESKIWSNETMNSVCKQLRMLKGMEVIRDHNAGTVVCTMVTFKGIRKEIVRGLKSPSGWITRFDNRLLSPAK